MGSKAWWLVFGEERIEEGSFGKSWWGFDIGRSNGRGDGGMVGGMFWKNEGEVVKDDFWVFVLGGLGGWGWIYLREVGEDRVLRDWKC